jgi:hypothetical protein
MKISRRTLLGMSAGLLAPGRLRAASTGERKLLVILCQGGWDTTRLFNPAFDNPLVSMEDTAEPYTVGNFTIVDSPERPTVRSWFDAYHSRVAMIHGMEVRSIAHERCLRLLMTGDGAAGRDDWPSTIAAASTVARALPYLVLSGPAYNAAYTRLVVRVGDDGQLPDLLTGDATLRVGTALPSATTAALQETLLRRRIAARRATAGRGAESALLDAYAASLDDLTTLQGGGGVDLAGGTVPELCGGVAGQIGIALDALQADLCRSAMIQYLGNCGPNWDQHSDIAHQSRSFEELFQHLDLVMEGLSTRPGSGGGTLLDEVTVLVCSEMGRHPMLNSIGGKDHWTTTSCLLFGAGVRGDVVVGGYDEDAFGEPVDLDTGETAETGVSLLPTHLGATLYAIAGVDPGEAVGEVIGAVVE